MQNGEAAEAEGQGVAPDAESPTAEYVPMSAWIEDFEVDRS